MTTDKIKICMVGATAVGKTSLVERFVSSIFDERYATTIGVRIESVRMQRGDRTFKVILWDLSGQDEFQSVRPEYLRGAAGYFVVVDGTRRETVETAVSLQELARDATNDAPFVVVLNKMDLVASWEIDARLFASLEARSWKVVRASAKTGEGVAAAFDMLIDAAIEEGGAPWI
jgi:small GTP-binding protein